MLAEDRVICSCRFPKLNLDDMEGEPLSQEEAEEGMKDVYRRYEEFMTRPEDPKRVKRGNEMVQRAIELSKAFELDMDALRGQRSFRAVFYLDYGPYMGELKEMFADLFALCDDFSFYRIPQRERDLNIDFTCYTAKSFPRK